MSFNITYKPLLSLNFYHHYFLDDGENKFDIPDALHPNLKEEQIEKYTLSSFARIVPTEETKKFLASQKIIFKQHKTGITLLIQAEEIGGSGVYKPFIELAQDENLQFLIYITDSIFENYSTVPAVPSIPYYFSNKQPSTEVLNWNKINVEPQPKNEIPYTTPIENFTITKETNTLLSNNLSSKERLQLFGVISLNVTADDTSKRSLLETSGNLPISPPIFKIQLANRKTFWQYLNAKDRSIIHISPITLPLVKNGIVAYTFTTSARRPAANPNRLIYVKDSSGTIIKTISEIFI